MTARVCMSAGCLPRGAKAVKLALEAAGTPVVGVGCLGPCSEGPVVGLDPGGRLFGHVRPEHARALVTDDRSTTALELDRSHPFFARQKKIVLENCGRVDPLELDDSLRLGAYAQLASVRAELDPGEVVQIVSDSGLRGRGGGGYPTGLKWSTVARARGETKYVICNADEGDPGAFMDRSVLEGDPHRVLEGMAIAGHAVGARTGFIYVRVEYPLAVERLTRAIGQARAAGLLGSSFDVELRLGAGAFVCGEETALMASIEGKRGIPRARPPYPAESGLWGAPTLINNVETFANIPPILREGARWFRSFGTPGSPGTKVFALTGRLKRVGLVEVPMGTPLSVLVEDMGGGALEGRTVRAAQTGGSSGGCIPPWHFDVPADFDSLSALGSMMGSGGLVVVDDRTPIPELARYFMAFSASESCGKCPPCRVGTRLLEQRLAQAAAGEPVDIGAIRSLCETMQAASACGLGQAAPNPVLSALRHFPDAFVARPSGAGLWRS